MKEVLESVAETLVVAVVDDDSYCGNRILNRNELRPL